MSNLTVLPLKFLGWTAAGLGLAVGWKLGSYLYDVAMDKKVRERFFEGCSLTGETAEAQALWKRTFSRVSGD
jgi:hypothetical protein